MGTVARMAAHGQRGTRDALGAEPAVDVAEEVEAPGASPSGLTPTSPVAATADPLWAQRPPPRADGGAHAEPGRPLDEGVRRDMEAELGQDLGRVRIHEGPRAQALTRDLDTDAVTVGSDIAFAPGQFQPESARGRHVVGTCWRTN